MNKQHVQQHRPYINYVLTLERKVPEVQWHYQCLYCYTSVVDYINIYLYFVYQVNV